MTYLTESSPLPRSPDASCHYAFLRQQKKDSYSPNISHEPLLTLRPLTHSYAKEFYQHYHSPGVIEGVEGEAFASLAEARQYLQAEEKDPLSISFAIIHRQYGFIGTAGYEYSDDKSCASTFYWLGNDYRQQGLGAMALGLLLEKARKKGLNHLFAFTQPHNLASQKTLIKNKFLPFPEALSLEENIQGFYLPFDTRLNCRQLQNKAGLLGFSQSDLRPLA